MMGMGNCEKLIFKTTAIIHVQTSDQSMRPTKICVPMLCLDHSHGANLRCGILCSDREATADAFIFVQCLAKLIDLTTAMDIAH